MNTNMCTHMKNSNPIDFWDKRINSRYANPCRYICIVHL